MKETIDHSNYEAFLLDRLEGNLSSEQLRMLELFLLKHPELDASDEEMPKVSMDLPSLLESELAELKRDLPPLAAVSESTLEDFLIASAEGDLTADQEKDLAIFLTAHPKHQHVAELIALSRILPGAQELPSKAYLQRNLPPTGLPNALNLDDFLIAGTEGDLVPEQEAALSAYLLDRPEAHLAYQNFQRARILPEQLVYEQKAELKKEIAVVPIGAGASIWVPWRMAASIAALLGIAFWVFQRGAPEEMIVVEQQQTEVPVESRAEGPQTQLAPQQESGVQSVEPKDLPAQRDLAVTEVDLHVPQNSPTAPQNVRGDRSELASQTHRGELFALESIAPRSPVLQPSALPMNELREIVGSIPEQGSALASTDLKGAPTADGIPIAAFIAGKVRESLLGTSANEPRPLDGDDAIAAADMGLKTLAGSASGIALERADDGRIASFDLRLGSNFSIRSGR